MKTRIIIILSFIICMYGATVVIVGHYKKGSQTPSDSKLGITNSDLPNYSDGSILLGHSHNVFVGKVIKQVGTIPPAPPGGVLSATSLQFAVNPILDIKGNLQGIVIVDQFITSWPPVDIGSTYVFAARYSSKDGWYIATIYPYDYQFLTNDEGLTDAQLKTFAENNDKVRALEAAYPHESLAPYDVKNNRAYNSYASRHYDANGQLIDDTVVLHEQYLAAHPSTSTEAAPAASSAPAESVSPTPDESTATDVTAVPTDSTTPAPSDTPTPTPSDAAVPAAS